MMFFFLLLVFIGTAAGLWFQGSWKNAMFLINIVLAGIIATNFFEPLATLINNVMPSATYLLDFSMLWVLFALTFLLLRVFTELAGAGEMKLPKNVDLGVRTVLAICSAWIFTCFTAFTMHTAPLSSLTPMGAWNTPKEGTFMGMAPDLMWMGFAHSRSAQALSRGNFDSESSDPNDLADANNVQPFDAKGEFIYKYRQRRDNFLQEESMLVGE